MLNTNYYNKYHKYKNKYLTLKYGGTSQNINKPYETNYLKVDDIRAIENTLDNNLGVEHYSNTLCSIVVQYHRDYRPFPCEMSYKQLLKQNECMQESLNKMRKVLCENLLEKSPVPECPVCYFDLKKETIELPMCFHAICNGCYKKCSKCPLCRKDY